MSNSPLNVQAYHVQRTATQLRAGFPYFSHHDSVSALWKEKWRLPCTRAIYPFTDAEVEDFDPIFARLIELSADDPAMLYNPAKYAQPFLPVANNLRERAERAEAEGKLHLASKLFLRSAAVFRIARFPLNRDLVSEAAWQSGKATYMRGASLLDPPFLAVEIPFTHADVHAADRDAPIQAFLRLPKGEKPASGWPVMLFICGLDAYKTDNTSRTDINVQHGIATILFEIPGTGDCPAAPNDPAAPDRLMSSVLDWVDAHASEFGLDIDKKLARGISTGGYYAIRIAHTHAERLFAVVSEGGGCHHMFDQAWITAQNQMEYPFALADALAWKFGYRGEHAIAAYRREAKKFSLLEGGILDLPSTRLLVLNGMEDTIFPIEDNLLVALSGKNKELLSRANVSHMGDPGGEQLLTEWIDRVLKEDPAGIGMPA